MNKTLIALIVVVILGGGYFLLSSNKTEDSVTIPLVTATPTASTSASPSAKIEENIVTVTTTGFEPQTLRIKAGTKVTWENKSGQAVTVNSDPHPAHTSWPFLNLGSFADGSSVSITFDKAGTYTYHNHFDASMKGTVVVSD